MYVAFYHSTDIQRFSQSKYLPKHLRKFRSGSRLRLNNLTSKDEKFYGIIIKIYFWKLPKIFYTNINNSSYYEIKKMYTVIYLPEKKIYLWLLKYLYSLGMKINKK